MFQWSSKEARVIRALVRLTQMCERLDQKLERAKELKGSYPYPIQIDLVALTDRYYRLVRAQKRLEDRLGASYRAAAEDPNVKVPA